MEFKGRAGKIREAYVLKMDVNQTKLCSTETEYSIDWWFINKNWDSYEGTLLQKGLSQDKIDKYKNEIIYKLVIRRHTFKKYEIMVSKYGEEQIGHMKSSTAISTP